ncbi:Filamin domain-containing protein [Cephalotus follicularis]|uniref:Filamin domain-containing protein n=1 Tax=Cephalotus follicularis TaxID=3775 RepID=A0A1Q3B8Q0_CEPFO|nr:Filamin domain-containing protein [Cephalotus follicularis]
MSTIIFLLVLSFFPLTNSEKEQVPNFAFSWLNDNNTFQAGDIATINIKVLGNFDDKNATLSKSAFKPTLTVNGKMGNSSFVSGVLLDTVGDTSTWRILFIPIMAGLFNVIINDDPFKVFDSSLHYNVIPGRMFTSVCVASWMGLINEFEAGTKATLLILPKDAFGNNISLAGGEPTSYNFTVSALYENGSVANMPNITYIGWKNFGYIVMEFVVEKAGKLLLIVEGENQTLIGSPLLFEVTPGPLDVSNCVAKWNFETIAWQLYSKMEIFIHQQDQHGNLVPGLYPFDADVVEKETNLTMPVADLHFEEVVPGIQLFSFSLLEPGNFLLTISDLKHNKSISSMPYAYTVFVGYCDGLNSVINGSGLNDSVAGETAEFTVYLNDKFQYPSPVELERIHVLIASEVDSYYAMASIVPLTIFNGSGPIGKPTLSAIEQIAVAPAPYADLINTSVGSSKVLVSAFNVIYTPAKSGIYEVRVFCGNILLNGGHPFKKEVRAGEVNESLSGAVDFTPKVPKQFKNEILVHLVDSYLNPVLSQESRLKLEIASINHSSFSSGMFLDNGDGSYKGQYLAMDVGTYEMCVSFDGKRFSSCPFWINVYSNEYFPKASDDIIFVWEDQSIAFDVIANDYFAGDNASIVEFSKPGHGSLMQDGQLLRYTPFKDYFGNDSFLYTMSDVNGNLATAAVNISVLTIPPQFVSYPSRLQATEDVLTPSFGGFSGFEIRYSDSTENIFVNLSARSGTLSLSPMLMQFWQPMWGGLSVKRVDNEAKNLILEGSVEVINLALQSIQYLGNENFYGEDIIRVSTRNRNGVNDLDVPVFVEPFNDPPFIHVPKFIILKSSGDESPIFEIERDKFEFAIGDPDLHNYPGGEAYFAVTFSVEVSDGFLQTSLPSELINTTELKLGNSNVWQPLQTYVTISKHFTVKANGIRFRGTINDCNMVMQQLYYHGGEYGVVLTVKLHDMGHYGCYSDCAANISVPLYAEATVNLIQRRPMSSLVAHSFGSAIVLEFLMVFSLGVLLMLFTCKCAIHLEKERRERGTSMRKSKLSSSMQTSQEQIVSTLETLSIRCHINRWLQSNTYTPV